MLRNSRLRQIQHSHYKPGRREKGWLFGKESAVVGPSDGAPGSLTQPRKQWLFWEQGPPAICWGIPIISPSPPRLVECLCEAVCHSQSSHPALYQCTLSPLANLVANSSLQEVSPLDSVLLLLYWCGCLSNSKDFRAGVSSDLFCTAQCRIHMGMQMFYDNHFPSFNVLFCFSFTS